MEIEWDEAKAEINLAKHAVDFEDAALVLSDPSLLTWEDPDAEGEQRFLGLGADAFGRILTVVYTHRDEAPRLISARRATANERRFYAERL